MYYPTRNVLPLRIMVRPMNNPTFVVPHILTIKSHSVTYYQTVDSRSDVDIVTDQQRLSGRKLNDESLVSRTIYIIRQNANHRALAFDLYVACPHSQTRAQ